MAGWFVVAASVMLLVTVYSSIASLNTVETRDRVTDWLSTPTGKDLGLSVSDALSGLRVALMVTGLGAAASGVLGFFVLQRHRGARIALSIVVVPILLANLVTAPLTGGLLGALIAAATVVLWTGPARDWFAGRPVRQPAVPEPREEPRPPAPTTPPPPAASAPVDLSTQRPSGQPPATAGFGERPAQQWGPPVGPPIGYQQPAVSVSVPMIVRVACVLTWVFAGVVALLYVVLLFVLVIAKDDIVDYVTGLPEWQQSNIKPDLLMPVLWVGSLMFLGWAVGAMVLAWFTWRRHNWARYLLAASAAAALLAGLFAFPVSLPHLVACLATIVMLFSARARVWFAMPRQGYWPPQGPPSGPPPGPPQGPPSYGPPPSGPPTGPPTGPPPDRSGKPPVW
jgi:amino acid transporter